MGVTLSGSQGLSSPQANGYVGDVMIPPKKFMKVAAFGVHAVNFLMLLQRLSPAIIRFLIQEVWSWFQDVAVQSSGIVTTSRYVVPTGRVKVPAGRYVVPTGKDNVIVSAGRSKVIPAGLKIYLGLDLHNAISSSLVHVVRTGVRPRFEQHHPRLASSRRLRCRLWGRDFDGRFLTSGVLVHMFRIL
ncbi:hypothetical protein Tco_1052758, partial [Tanacetum coccineum]